jgi:hypothetical protein
LSIGGGQIGNLMGTGWRDWNLADRHRRDAVIDEIRDALAQVALPWFDLVKSGDRLVEHARGSDVPGLDIEQLIPWLTFLGRPPDDVAEIAARWLWRWGDAGPGVHRLARVRPVVKTLHISVALPDG